MNIGQIVTMLLRMFARQLFNRSVNAATRPKSRRPGQGSTAQSTAHQAGKRTRQALNMLRRLGR